MNRRGFAWRVVNRQWVERVERAVRVREILDVGRGRRTSDPGDDDG